MKGNDAILPLYDGHGVPQGSLSLALFAFISCHVHGKRIPAIVDNRHLTYEATGSLIHRYRYDAVPVGLMNVTEGGLCTIPVQ